MPPFTEVGVKEMLRLSPQTVSMDEEDLQRLRNLCNLRRPFRSADYLWLDLVDAPAPTGAQSESKVAVEMTDTRADGSSLTFWSTVESPLSPLPGGYYKIASRLSAVIELKTIETDLHVKLGSVYKRGKAWNKEARRILAAHLQERLRDANRQIRDTKRLLRYQEAMGIVIVLESRRTVIPPAVYTGYLGHTMKSLDCVDGVLYFSNDAEGAARAPHYIRKNVRDTWSRRFHQQIDALLQIIDADSDGNVSSRFAQPDHVAQVVVDSAARLAFADDWEEALRLGHSVTINFQERSRFQPGIGPQT